MSFLDRFRPAPKISARDIDPDALSVLHRLHHAGFVAYLVGGGVRDILLGRAPKDFAVATDARPGQIKRLFRNAFIIGRRFRLALIRFGEKQIETATFRRDPEPDDAPGPAAPGGGDSASAEPERGPVQSFVTILYGCNRHCSYCIVPHVRGREESRGPREILAEVRAEAARGARDVCLLGQSVMRYGRLDFAWPDDLPSPMGFTEPLPRLLERIALDVPEVPRLRFTSGHPAGVTPELVRAMREIPAVCAHLHLPMQSGSDRILREMRRGYDAEGYLRAVRMLREGVPDVAITTDVIVGYPGETEEDFEATRRVMEEADFDNAFVFKEKMAAMH